MLALQIYKLLCKSSIFFKYLLFFIISYVDIMIKVENLTFKYEQNCIFKNLSFEIKKNEKVSITGPSGCGKSSLLSILAGFQAEFDGSVKINGLELNAKNVRQIRNFTAWVPQNVSLRFDYVKDLFTETYNLVNNKKNIPSERKIFEMLEKFNLEKEIVQKKFADISTGEKQRILTVNSLLLNKSLLIIDEPTASLDSENKERLCDIICAIPDLTVIAATHDEYFSQKSNKIIHLTH